ncbi:unnamed protein product [Polarella glacialis]|uniref:Uncharacterized protein n=1 Tax=Polarella glacialis TaxID=89957 RepID=A0A813KAV8_POLGL|nr:unnamed protein product [Polarella glacialis]
MEVEAVQASCLPPLLRPGVLRRRFGGGPVKMSSDPLKRQRAEVARFDALLAAIDKCRSEVAKAVAMLKAAPEPLLDQLQRLYPGKASCPVDGDGGPLVARLAEQLGSCALRLAAGEPHLEAMQRLLRELQEKTAVADLAFDTRDAAWDSKSHYDFKVEKLKKHPARSGMSFTMEDRVLRNKQKQKESSAAFEKASAEAARAADTVLETRWCSTASALSELTCEGITSRDPGSSLHLRHGPRVLNCFEIGRQICRGTKASKVAFVPLARESCESDAADSSADDHEEKPPTPDIRIFKKGEKVEVWSSSEGRWLEALVEEVFTEDCVSEGYVVPAGCIKVSSAIGVKFVPPEQIAKLLRELALAQRVFRKGDRAEVWSSSLGRWFEAVIEEVYPTSCEVDGYAIPAGCIKAVSKVGVKYVPVEQASAVLRQLNPGVAD